MARAHKYEIDSEPDPLQERRSGLQARVKAYCERIKLPDEGCEYVQSALANPSRRPDCIGNNVTGSYPSPKLGETIMFGSRSNMLYYILKFEHDPDIFLYLDYPPPLTLQYEDAKGRIVEKQHTPHFLVLGKDAAFVCDCKIEEQLVRKQQKWTDLYRKTEEGKWCTPAGREATLPLGLGYHVYSTQEINYVRMRNTMFLEDYLMVEHQVSQTTVDAVMNLVTQSPGITLSSLFSATDSAKISPDDIFALIATNILYVDLDHTFIGEFEEVSIFRDSAVCWSFRESNPVCARAVTIKPELGTRFLWNGNQWVIKNIGIQFISAINEALRMEDIPLQAFYDYASTQHIRILEPDSQQSAGLEILSNASPSDFKKADFRLEVIRASESHFPLPVRKKSGRPLTERTARAYKAMYKHGEDVYGFGYIGLIPSVAKRGNQSPRIDAKRAKHLREFIEADYMNARAKTISTSYRAFKLSCAEKKLKPISLVTFWKTIKRWNKHDAAVSRYGDRFAYKFETWIRCKNSAVSRHGDFPFHIVHIDHTQLDIFLRSSENEEEVEKPWLTIMICARTRRVLSAVITFDSPSYISCMLAFRECVSRYSRLPQILVVDGGREFRSIAFNRLCGMYFVQKWHRPYRKSRFSGVCERLFGTSDKQFIHNLLGNSKLMKQVRMMHRSVDPRKLTDWTLPVFGPFMKGYLYNVYDQMEQTSIRNTPRREFDRLISKTGQRRSRVIVNDEQFRILTLPSTPRGVAKVIPNRGVQVNGLYYWSESMRNPEAEERKVPVRFDPDNAGVAYFWIGNNWVEGNSDLIFHGKTLEQIAHLSAEIRKERSLTKQRQRISSQQLAEYLSIIEQPANHKPIREEDSTTEQADSTQFENSKTTNEDLIMNVDEVEGFEDL